MKIIYRQLLIALLLGPILILASCNSDEDAKPKLSITSFTPETGVIGAAVTITGSKFSSIATENIVKFNNTTAVVSSASSTQLITTVPVGATSGKITITVGSETATSPTDFVVELPSITSVTPGKGLVGATITISGSNFSSVAAENIVKFNNTAAVVSSASATQLVTTVPDGATSGKITVTVGSETATSPADFTIVIPPTFTSFAPLYALPGESVTITGTNFSTITTDNMVTINDVAADVTSATATTLIVTIPVGASTGKIAVTVNDVKVTSVDDFEVLKDIPRDGLVAFYKLDGNANDDSGNSLNGSLHGTTNGGPAATANRFGTASKSLQFDGTDDYASMGNPAQLQISNTITVAGWFNIDAYKASNQMQAILTKIYFDPNQGGNPTRGYRVSQDFYGGGTPTLYAGCHSTAGLSLSTYVGDAISTGSWIFFALTLDGSNYKFYQDGVLKNDASASVTILDDGSIGDLILGNYGGGFFFDGSIDDVTIYNRALTDTEITQVYEQTVSKY